MQSAQTTPGTTSNIFCIQKAHHIDSCTWFFRFLFHSILLTHIKTETICCPLLPPSSSSVLPSTPHLIDPSHIPECTYSFCVLVIFPIFSCSFSITLSHLLIHSSLSPLSRKFFYFHPQPYWSNWFRSERTEKEADRTRITVMIKLVSCPFRILLSKKDTVQL